MKPTFTKAWMGVLIFFMGLMGTQALAQGATELGDEFIFFVEGKNIQVPTLEGGSIVIDPQQAGNKVVQFNYSNWSHPGFAWPIDGGVDASQNRADGDILYLRILSDPANANKGGGSPDVQFNLDAVRLMFTDRKAEGDGDYEFRANWAIPQWVHDGQWHDLAIPLPPATWQELEDARSGLDSLSQRWAYRGAWSDGGFGIGLNDPTGPNTTERPELWTEFQWDKIKNFGIHFDHNAGGGPIYIDEFYIGGPGTDLTPARIIPPPASGLTVTADDKVNTISWGDTPSVVAYNVFVSEDPITDIFAANVSLLTSVTVDANAGAKQNFQAQHSTLAPHPALATRHFYYAVTSLTAFGVSNDDVTNSSGSTTNTFESQPFIFELTESETDAIVDNITNGTATSDGWPVNDFTPFVINQQRFKVADAPTPPDSDADLAGTFYFGYTPQNELLMYAEVQDEFAGFLPAGGSGGDGWQYDSIEIGWGGYDVPFGVGSSHNDMERGDNPDFQFRISPYDDGSVSTFVGWSLDAEIPGSASVKGDLMDGSGNVIGYKVLTFIPLDQISAAGDALFAVPTTAASRLIPFTIVINDADNPGGFQREHQISWSIADKFTGQWWNTPSDWDVVALAGRTFGVSNENPGELPTEFDLAQNYPNPFNPSTSIQFNLPVGEHVTLAVYNTLGQRVATLVNNQRLGAGTHTVPFRADGLSSGIYFYKLEAGNGFVQTKKMVLMK